MKGYKAIGAIVMSVIMASMPASEILATEISYDSETESAFENGKADEALETESDIIEEEASVDENNDTEETKTEETKIEETKTEESESNETSTENLTEEQTKQETTTEEMLPESTETEKTSIVESDEDVNIDVFSGMPQTYKLSAEELDDKKALASSSDSFWSMTEGVDYVKGEVLVTGSDSKYINTVAQAYDAEVIETMDYVAVLKLDEGVTVAQAVEAASDIGNNMPAVWPNYYRHTYGGSTSKYNDPYLNKYETHGWYQWHHGNINSEAAWQAGYTGKGVKVAVIDTGCMVDHADLTGKFKGQWNTANGNANVVNSDQKTGHGTHVAGIIGATANNSKYGCGVAPDADLYAIRVTDDANEMTDATIIAGINKAVGFGVDLINMSLGGHGYTRAYDASVKNALDNGVVLFAAAGNEASNAYTAPADVDGVICIGATNSANNKASFSNYGPYVDFAAPGVNIISSVIETYDDFVEPGNKEYGYMSGTSMACPVAVGEAAVILSAHPELLADKSANRQKKIIEIMKKGAVKAGSDMGAGIVDLRKALDLSDNSVAPKAPEFTVKGGTYPVSEKEIGLVVNPGLKYYYTDNGKNPTYKNGIPGADTKLYSGVISVKQQKTTIKAIAVNGVGLCSKVVNATYVLTPPVSGIAITGVTNKIAVGGSTTLTAAITPEYVSNKKVNWSISPANANVTVNNVGKITVKNKPEAAGKYTITATSVADTTKQATYELEVAANIDAVKTVAFKTKAYTEIIKDANKTINLAEQLTATTESGAAATVNEFSWSCNNTTLASVDQKGVVTLKASPEIDGKVTVTALAKDGKNKKAVVNINVKRAINSMSMQDTKLAPGKSVSVVPTTLPAKVSNKNMDYSIEPVDSDVTVKNGKVTAKATAQAGKEYTITAITKDGFETKATCKVVITKDAVNAIQLSQKKYTLYRTGISGAETQFKLTATAQYKSGITDAAPLQFTSNNTGIATVDNTGLVSVTGNGIGKVTITCTAMDGSNKKATCAVDVVNPASRISINAPAGSGGYVARGYSIQLKEFIESDYGKISKQNIEWSSSRADVKVVNGKITPDANASLGPVVITASLYNGKLKSTYTANVTKPSGGYEFIAYNEIVPKCGEDFRVEVSDGKYITNVAPDVTVSSSNDSLVGAFIYRKYVDAIQIGYAPGKKYNRRGSIITVTVKANDGTGAKATYKIRFAG